MSEDEGGDGNFLRRWSRRKHESVRAAQAPAADAQAPVAEPPGQEEAARAEGAPVQAEAPGPLPDTSTLDGLRSEYQDFLKPDVDEGVRRAALKKLFADPHFAGMDPIEFYSQDYTRPDPIPAAMLATLNQARGLLFPHEDEKPREAPDPADGEAAQADARPALPAEGEAGPAAAAPEKPVPGDADAGKSGASG